jgi:hypothetical protein
MSAQTHGASNHSSNILLAFAEPATSCACFELNAVAPGENETSEASVHKVVHALAADCTSLQRTMLTGSTLTHSSCSDVLRWTAQIYKHLATKVVE